MICQTFKTDANPNVLTQTIETINNMEYSEQKLKLISIVMEGFKNNTTEKGANIAQRNFLHNGFKTVVQEGRDPLTN